MTDINDWSRTAADNASSDSAINWAEGQAPSTVNGSARYMMARIAEWRGDIAPVRSSSGSGNAYTITAYSGLTGAYRDGEMYAFIADRTNAASCTLNVNGRGAVAMRPAVGVAHSPGEIQINQVVLVYYRAATAEFITSNTGYHVNAMTEGLLTQNITSRLLKIGDPVFSLNATPEQGRIRLTQATQTLNKADWPELNSWLSGQSYPWGSAATTFNLPPAAGYFVRIAGTNTSIDPGGPRAAGSTQTDLVKAHTHGAGTLAADSAGAHTHTLASSTGFTSAGSGVNAVGSNSSTGTTSSDGAHTHVVSGSTAANVGAENRPVNVALHLDIVASTALTASLTACFGFPYQYDGASTSAGDPGAGKWRGNSLTLASITEIYVSETDSYGVNLSGLLGSELVGSRIRFSKVAAQASQIVVTVSSAPTDDGSYRTIPVSVAVSNGSLADLDKMSLEITGGPGPTGATGATGATGSATSYDYETRAAAILATIPSGNTFLRTGGYATLGDGGHALYTKVGSEPAHAGKLQSADGAWWELSDELPNVRQFGAVGDGSTDDTAEIQSAVTFAAAGVLYFPPGIYLVSGSTASPCITLPATGIRIVGAGRYVSTIKMGSAVAAAAFVGVDASKIEFENLGFDLQATARLAWQRAMVLRGVQDVSITNCRFYRVGDGGVLLAKTGFGGSDSYGEGTLQPKRALVSGCEFTDCYGTVAIVSKYTGCEDFQVIGNRFTDACSIAVSIESENGVTDYAKRTVVSGNVISGCTYTRTGGLSTVAWGISFGELVQDCVISGNVIDVVTGDTVSAGILVSTSPSQTDEVTRVCSITGNTIRDVTASSGRGHGVLLQAGNTDATDIAVSSNVITSCEDGISIECDAGAATTGYVRGISITGNVINAPTEFGIWTSTVSSSGSLSLKDATIVGNVIRNSGSHGMSMFATESVITGNKVQGATGVGLSLLTGSDKLTISGNNITGSGSDGMSLSVTGSSITGNVSSNNGQIGGGTNYGCYITAGTNNTVTGNVFSDDQGSPTQNYGFRGTATTKLFDNDMLGNADGPIFGGLGSVNDGTFDLALNRTSASGGSWLEDPNSDRMRFWDDSAGVETWLSPGSTLAITGTTVDVTSLVYTSGGTDVAVVDGGTGSSTARGAAANLGTEYILANSGVVSSHTGTTSETTLATVTIPAGAMGPNGAVIIRVLYSWTSSANSKTPRIRFGGAAGTIYHGFTATTTTGQQMYLIIRNRNSASSQVGQPSAYAGIGSTTAAIVTSSIDTTAAVDVLIRGILGDASETISVEGYTVSIMYGA